jgi:hypothetical protein
MHDATISLPSTGKILHFREFEDFCTQLESIVGPCSVLLDLTRVKFAQPSGMAPIIAVVRSLTDLGWTFDVDLPDDEYLSSYFDKAGWSAAITGDEFAASPLSSRSTFIPLSHYSSGKELNPILNSALDHFARKEVYGAGVLAGIEWAMSEVADNVLIHAGGVSGWIQLVDRPKKGLIEIVVADCGVGISSSLREGILTFAMMKRR